MAVLCIKCQKIVWLFAIQRYESITINKTSMFLNISNIKTWYRKLQKILFSRDRLFSYEARKEEVAAKKQITIL